MSNIQKCWCGGGIVWHSHKDPSCLESVYHDPVATGRPERIEVIYVAGPMSNYPDNNYPAFNEAADRLRAAGYKVVNPAEFGSHGGHYVDLIREDLRVMLDAHAVATLENWWESAGARNEVQVAGLLRMPVRTVAEWLERAALELSR